MMGVNNFFEILLSTNQINKCYIIEDRNLDVKQEGLGRTNRLLSFDTTSAAYKTTSLTILLTLSAYFFRDVFAQPLPSKVKGDTYSNVIS
jgi:hypothetical protein